MSKIYLQEKIEPIPGQYVIVGEDGFLTVGNLPAEAHPQIIITAPEGLSVSNFSATCNNNSKTITFTKLLDNKFICSPAEFGVWNIIATTNETVMQEDVDVTDIQTYNITLAPQGGGGEGPIGSLEATSWSDIQTVINNGLASSYWSLGDRKAVVLNGTMGTITFNNNYTIYAYVIGFDHNVGIEGAGVTFKLGFPSSSSTSSYAFVDAYYNTNQPYDNNCFHMNYDSDMSGESYLAWENCRMRIKSLNGISNSLLTCLPVDLVAVCTSKSIYTNNSSRVSGEVASDITVTQDKLFILSEYEMFGQRTYANSYEQLLQKQYDYYKSYTKRKYKHSAPSSGCAYWTRSRTYNDDGYFCIVSTSGTSNIADSLYSYGVAPAFHIGTAIPTTTNIYTTKAGSTTTTSSRASSYFTIDGNGPYYNAGKYLVNSGSIISIHGKRGTHSGTTANVRLKIDNTIVGNTTTSSSSYTSLFTYVVPDNLKGVITVELVYTSVSSSTPATLYVLLNTGDTTTTS